MAWWGASLVLAALAGVLLVAFTPLRALVPGYGTASARALAQRSAVRLAGLQDSLSREAEYRQRLRQLMTGQIDSAFAATAMQAEPDLAVTGELAAVAAEPRTEDWRDHDAPAETFGGVAAGALPAGTQPLVPTADVWHLPRLRFPVAPPVEGFITRSFDARSGHFATDIAVPEGTAVRAIGAGYVIMADQTLEGGHVIAVQHAGGYVSIYKHNKRLLKRVGDRVSEGEPVAESGNSGEITTGPHLHVELWRGGLAQDPARFVSGW